MPEKLKKADEQPYTSLRETLEKLHGHRSYTTEKYIELVEKIKDPILQEHMKVEREMIHQVQNPHDKTFIDLGAGYGRVLPDIAKIARNVISIEISPEMLHELTRRAEQYGNAKVIAGNMTKLSEILKNENVQKPVLLLLQNTLGTVEGDWKKVLHEMKKVAREKEGEIIISVFRQESLESWGIKMYSLVSGMTGEPDSEKTDFQRGIFFSKTGYASKWWNRREIEEMKRFLGGALVGERGSDEYCVMHIRY
jgi:ubiquinone/menaquinone biosynthesis C-methylase UbiE